MTGQRPSDATGWRRVDRDSGFLWSAHGARVSLVESPHLSPINEDVNLFDVHSIRAITGGHPQLHGVLQAIFSAFWMNRHAPTVVDIVICSSLGLSRSCELLDLYPSRRAIGGGICTGVARSTVNQASKPH